MRTKADLPCVGDWVLVQYHNSDTLAIVHALFPRKSELRRKTSGKKIDYQMIASNIDVAFRVGEGGFPVVGAQDFAKALADVGFRHIYT